MRLLPTRTPAPDAVAAWARQIHMAADEARQGLSSVALSRHAQYLADARPRDWARRQDYRVAAAAYANEAMASFDRESGLGASPALQSHRAAAKQRFRDHTRLIAEVAGVSPTTVRKTFESERAAYLDRIERRRIAAGGLPRTAAGAPTPAASLHLVRAVARPARSV